MAISVEETNFEKVKEFMKIFGQKVQSTPEWPNEDILCLRTKLIEEEVEELLDGVDRRDFENVAKELTDILYVVYGMGAALGIDLDAAFQEVHRSNLSKLENGKVLYRKDGKVMKGKDYSPANLCQVLIAGTVGHP
jgi:predicted HAD superfamily Cof-like phosphohydrolase